MANELKLVFELEPPIPMTCANGTGIELGTLLKISDPLTVAKTDGAAQDIAGVLAEEKIASDGKTKCPVYLRGVFRAIAGGTITVGDSLIAENGTNEVLTSTAATNGMQVCGVALETAADGESFLMLLNVGIGGTPET